jgi:hypothetical protein
MLAVLELIELYRKQALEKLETCTVEEMQALQGEIKAYRTLTKRVRNGSVAIDK